MENSKDSGSANLVAELDLMFQIYADEIKSYRTGNEEKVLYLKDDKMFDIMIKLLNNKDKIAKLNISEEGEEKSHEKQSAKVRNIQDITLNEIKA